MLKMEVIAMKQYHDIIQLNQNLGQQLGIKAKVNSQYNALSFLLVLDDILVFFLAFGKLLVISQWVVKAVFKSVQLL